MVDPVGYILIRTHKLILDKKKIVRHPVNMVFMNNDVYSEETEDKNVYDNLADAIIEKNKREAPENFIILPYW